MDSSSSGRLDEPQFHDVPARGAFQPPARPWDWGPIVDAVRKRPGEEAIVARYEVRPGVTRRDTRLARSRDANNLRMGLLRRYPLERWRVSCRMEPRTFYTRLITLTFLGYVTEEEREELTRHSRDVGALRKKWREEAVAKRGMADHARTLLEAEQRRRQALGIRDRLPPPA